MMAAQSGQPARPCTDIAVSMIAVAMAIIVRMAAAAHIMAAIMDAATVATIAVANNEALVFTKLREGQCRGMPVTASCGTHH